MLVGAGVVHDQVDIKVLGDRLLDLAQEAQEFLVPVAGPALCQHLSGGHVQGSEQSGGAVADVVMRDALPVAKSHRQQRLGLIPSLDVRLLVDAEHHRLVRWVQVQTDDVPDLLHKERVGGELVALRLPRSGTTSVGAAAPRRPAAIGARWFWRSPSPQPGSGHSSGCCRREAWSAVLG